MREDQHRFLSLLGQLPARLTAEQAAWVLNCQPHDVPVLVVARLLKPLGNPLPNSVKYFASVDVLELAKDPAWLGKITNAVNLHWRKKNAAKKNRLMNSAENGQGHSGGDGKCVHVAGSAFVAANRS
jgi:hypothetical protein